MKKLIIKYTSIIFLKLILFIPLVSFSQLSHLVFPDTKWEKLNPEKNGWSVSKLMKAETFFDSLPPASVLIIDKGKVIAEWGDPAMRIKISSMRKSLLSCLYGIHVHGGDMAYSNLEIRPSGTAQIENTDLSGQEEVGNKIGPLVKSQLEVFWTLVLPIIFCY